MLLKLLWNLNNEFPKKRLLGCELPMLKIGQLSTELGLIIWWCSSLHAKGHFPLRHRVHPSITNDYHIWSLHKVTYGGHHSIHSILNPWSFEIWCLILEIWRYIEFPMMNYSVKYQCPINRIVWHNHSLKGFRAWFFVIKTLWWCLNPG